MALGTRHPPVVQKVCIMLAGLNHWRRLKNAYLILIGSCYFARIGAAVQCGDLYIAMIGARYDLDALERACQDDHIATGSISLKRERKKEESDEIK